jgi:predicted RNase H-like HicB family nuclease
VFPIVIEHDEDGFFADCPSLQGCHAQGATYEELWENIRDAVELHIQDRKARGETIEPPRSISISTLEVSA